MLAQSQYKEFAKNDGEPGGQFKAIDPQHMTFPSILMLEAFDKTPHPYNNVAAASTSSKEITVTIKANSKSLNRAGVNTNILSRSGINLRSKTNTSHLESAKDSNASIDLPR
jgi:hypothetical protein